MYNSTYHAQYRLEHKEDAKQWRVDNKDYMREYDLARRQKSKLIVLTYYGKNGTPCCCWEGCEVSDLDMLTLDHINNDGKSDRLKNVKGNFGGHKFYTYLQNLGLPTGKYQTLCWNHQWKKELDRRRGGTDVTK